MNSSQASKNPTAEPVITVEGLTRTYKGSGKGAYTAVDNVSFHVNKGEVYGLLGTNGAGKTSTLEIIEGLAKPTSGHVTVLGKNPFTQRKETRPDMGIMLQSGGLPQELTVQETLDMWHGTCTHPVPTSHVLQQVNLEHRTGTKVASLSGGEQRRLDLACALLGDPTVIFLDEPTTGLDPESRHRTWDLLSQLKARGVTMVLTTHYLEEAEALCDRIGIMHGGKIHVEGTLRDLVDTQPATISFTWPDRATAPEDFPEFPSARVQHTDSTTTIHTHQLQAHALKLLTWADTHNLQLLHFTAAPASLEDIFMNVAGTGA